MIITTIVVKINNNKSDHSNDFLCHEYKNIICIMTDQTVVEEKDIIITETCNNLNNESIINNDDNNIMIETNDQVQVLDNNKNILFNHIQLLQINNLYC